MTTPYQPVKKPKANPLLFVLLVVFLLLDAGFGVLIVKTISDRRQSDMPLADTSQNQSTAQAPSGSGNTNQNNQSKSIFSGANIDSELDALATRVADAQQMIQDEQYGDASGELEQILNEYATLASENDAYDEVNAYAGPAFDVYTAAMSGQVQIWEDQNPNVALYQQIEASLLGSLEFADALKNDGLSIDTSALETSLNELPGRYKEKYILTFNDLRTGDEWSRTTAWQYMQDAASAGLIDRSNPDDPLTLRYAYSLAWITQREVTEGLNNGDMATDEAISYILSVIETADYNPVLMRDLGSYLESCGYTYDADAIKDACFEVWSYMAYTENLYINPADMFIPGKTATNASSTVALNDFWYFNDFGEYSISSTNGVTPEGRQYIRDIYANALASL